MKILSITVEGRTGRTLRMDRKDDGVELVMPKERNQVVGRLTPDDSLETIMKTIVPIVYGRDARGKFNCTNSEAHAICDEVERLF